MKNICHFVHYIFFNYLIGVQSLPDASREGALKSFTNYKDITMFHFIVPRETIRATWQFAAFMDDKKCIPRKFYM